MKLIEALKKLKMINNKLNDLESKIRRNCAKMSYADSVYADQKSVVAGWIQAHTDCVMELEILRERIARTNIETQIEISLPNGKTVTKSIHRWISRKKDLATLERAAWECLTDMGLSDQNVRTSGSGDPAVVFKVVRFFDPKERDRKIVELREEVSVIDGKLEIANALTDLKE